MPILKEIKEYVVFTGCVQVQLEQGQNTKNISQHLARVEQDNASLSSDGVGQFQKQSTWYIKH